MLQLQTTNKKTGEVFQIVSQEERVTLLNVQTNEEKSVSQSTLKRWYTKPVEVVVDQAAASAEQTVEVEEVAQEEVVTEEVVVAEPEQVTVEQVIEEKETSTEEVEQPAEEPQAEEVKPKRKKSSKKLKMHERPEVVQSNSLKEFFLNDVLKDEDFCKNLKINVCQDKTVTYYYKDVCVMRIKGVKKVTIAFASKFLNEATRSQMQMLPKSYRRTHNSYILLENENQIPLLISAFEQSIAGIEEMERLAQEVEAEISK